MHDPKVRLDRREVVRALLDQRGELLVVTGLGSPAYDVMAAGDHPGNFYLWGAMGAAAMMGLGLALARPDRPVAVITGDGEQLMALGSLATIGAAAPNNLAVVVLDNQRYGETGMQPSHTAFGVDMAGIAHASGFAWSVSVADEPSLGELRERLHACRGPGFGLVKVRTQDSPRVLPPRDGVEIKNRFRRELGFGTI